MLYSRALVLGSAFLLSSLAACVSGEETSAGGTPPAPAMTGTTPPAAPPGGEGVAPVAPPSTPPSTPPASGTKPTPPPPIETSGQPSVDAAPASTPPTPAPPAPAAAGSFTCTLLFGINATAEWYNAGFETMVDGARWELVRVHSGFVDKWADANSPFWGTAPSSACAMNPKAPDRIIFIGLRFEWTDKAQWVEALTAVVKNLKAKYPGVKRIELGTFVRGPGNKPCGSRPAYRSSIHPSQDDAIAEVVATDPALLVASPRFEVDSCADFSGNPPHFSGAGPKTVARKIAEHYGK